MAKNNREKTIDGLLNFLRSEKYSELVTSQHYYGFSAATVKKYTYDVKPSSISYHLRRLAEEGTLELISWGWDNRYKMGINGMAPAIAKMRIKKQKGRRTLPVTPIEFEIWYSDFDIERFGNNQFSRYKSGIKYYYKENDNGVKNRILTDYLIPQCSVIVKGVQVGYVKGSSLLNNDEEVNFGVDGDLYKSNQELGLTGLSDATYKNINNFIKRYSKKNWEKLDNIPKI